METNYRDNIAYLFFYCLKYTLLYGNKQIREDLKRDHERLKYTLLYGN